MQYAIIAKRYESGNVVDQTTIAIYRNERLAMAAFRSGYPTDQITRDSRGAKVGTEFDVVPATDEMIDRLNKEIDYNLAMMNSEFNS